MHMMQIIILILNIQ